MPQVALVMHPRAMLYEVGIASEVFGVDRSELSVDGRWFELMVCTADGSPHPWLPGHLTASYAEIAAADLVVIPSTDAPGEVVDPSLIDALRAAAARGARIAALCTGAFMLAAAGLLDGRTATTHWLHAEELAQQFPDVEVRADVLYCDDGTVSTSAGKTAALDLCLHLVAGELGAGAASGLARRLVVPAHRAGGQAQFVSPPVGPRDAQGLQPTLDWASHRLEQPLTVADLAAHAGMSTRQLHRRMLTDLQARPLQWLHRQRVDRARELLERTDATMEQIAERCGLGTPATLRRHFHRTLGVPPTTYRATFRVR